jgi:hypothetical protein
MPVGSRPPWVKISQRLASLVDLLGVDGDDDALVAELVGGFGDQSGFDGGGVDRDLVGARPAASLRTSSTVRTPPPTVSGMKHCSAVRATTSKIVSRLSEDAVMSRKQSSSAPAAS